MPAVGPTCPSAAKGEDAFVRRAFVRPGIANRSVADRSGSRTRAPRLRGDRARARRRRPTGSLPMSRDLSVPMLFPPPRSMLRRGGHHVDLDPEVLEPSESGHLDGALALLRAVLEDLGIGGAVITALDPELGVGARRDRQGKRALPILVQKPRASCIRNPCRAVAVVKVLAAPRDAELVVEERVARQACQAPVLFTALPPVGSGQVERQVAEGAAHD